MSSWIERARREIPKTPRRPTANTDERTLMAVTAVPRPAISEISGPVRSGREAVTGDVEADRLARLRESFDVVTGAFRCPPGEVELAWSVALQDIEAAESAFHADAALIRAGWNPLREHVATFMALQASLARRAP